MDQFLIILHKGANLPHASSMFLEIASADKHFLEIYFLIAGISLLTTSKIQTSPIDYNF
jgi:hypothetical protein